MHYLYSKVAKIHVRYLATESKGNSVLLIHGLGGSIESWINNIEIISSHGFQVIALDLPGFGLSDKPQITYNIKYYFKFISKFINPEALNIIPETIDGMAKEYLNGINWICEYYFNGWKGLNLKWYYRYYRAPLFLDIYNLKLTFGILLNAPPVGVISGVNSLLSLC